jgi:hypothetical protein
MPKSIPSRAGSSTASLVSRESSSSQRARVTVVFGGTPFPKTTKITVPVTSSTTFAELQFEALRRARTLRVDIPSNDLVLHIESEDGDIAYEEDFLEQILDMREKNVLWIGPAHVGTLV